MIVSRSVLHVCIDVVCLFVENFFIRCAEWRAQKATEEIGWLWKRVR